MSRYNIMESFNEALNLFLYSFSHPRVTKKLHVLQLILLCNWDMFAAYLQLDLLKSTELIRLVNERQIQRTHIVLHDPLHILIELIILVLNVVIRYILPKHVLVERTREVRV